MTSSRLWDRAASLPVRAGDRRRPEILALRTDIPSLDDLLTFMRDAELRFETLRMRIEEQKVTAEGAQLTGMDVLLRHPGWARVTTSEAARGTAGNYEVWLSDGETVRTYAARHRLGTHRPVRTRVRGLDEEGFPGPSRVYSPLTALPMETLPQTFVHPAGFCQNVLMTGRTWVSGTDVVAGREAIVVDCDHPRAIEVFADRPDFHITIAVDRADGVILRLVESTGRQVTRDAVVTAYQPNAPLPPTAFDFEFPAGTTMLY